MSKTSSPQTLVDHYLQIMLLTRLSVAGQSLRFSELKEDGVDNSLFMYHANKLISRKLITKDDRGFHLTTIGARWINSVGRDMKYDQQTAKPLVQFVVQDQEGNMLLSSRKGQLKALLNDYMLPGGLHKSGMSAGENAQRIARDMLGDKPLVPELLSVVENINIYQDGFVYHSLSHIYSLHVKSTDPISSDDRFAFEWFAKAQIRTDNPLFSKSLFLPLFVAKLQDNQLQSHEVIRVEYK